MEQNLPVLAKRIWSIVRVAFFMLRKGLMKRKLMVDLNMMLKRGKIAGKALSNLLLHHHHHHNSNNNNNNHSRHVSSYVTPPNEYEFSCSNTPNYTFPFHLNKRKNNYHHFFGCAHAPLTQDDDVVTVNAVNAVLEMLNNDVVVEASPALPGFGRSPFVRPLRITDSPFPLRDVDEDNGRVDKAAEEFIQKFYKELKKQKGMSMAEC